MNEKALNVPDRRDRLVIAWILAISTAAILFLFWLIYMRERSDEYAGLFTWLPAVNASLNALAALSLVCGFAAIRAKRIRLHMTFMLSAFVVSSLFLVTYIIYHSVHGDTKFLGEGAIRTTYFVILVSHIVLSVVMLPMILTTFYFAFTKRFHIHRRLARITLPIWLYVSVTGVAIYFLLKAHS